MSIYAESIRQRWPKMETGWVNDIAAVMQQVLEAQLPEMEKDLRQQLANERAGRDEYAIENHRLRGEMARVQEENAKLAALAAPPIDEIAAILYPASFSERGRKGFTKAVNTVAEWLDLVAPESVPEGATEPVVQVEQQQQEQALVDEGENVAVDAVTHDQADQIVE